MISTTTPDIMYNLRGLDMVTPDQIIDDRAGTAGRSPHAMNSRMYAQDIEPRTAIASRDGIGFYTIPVGEAENVVNTTTTSQSDQSISYLDRVAQRFTPTLSKRLTRIDLLLKNNTSNDVIVVSVHEDVSGNIGNRIALSAVQNQDVPDTYGYVTFRFPQAPLLTASSNYWIVVSAQDKSVTNTYHLSRTTAGSNLMTSIDGGTVFTATTGSINYKTHLADDAPVLWQKRYVKSDGTKQTLFAVGGSSPAIYRVTNESTGAITPVVTGLNSNAVRYRSAIVGGELYIVNGYDDTIIWNGTTVRRLTHDPVLFPVPCNIIVFKNRVFYYNKDNPTRVYFSELAPAYDTIDSLNFFYVPEPSSPDGITGWIMHNDQLVIFTSETKHSLYGYDLSTFKLSQNQAASHGAVSQESICLAESRVYFWSVDGGPYVYDGAQDRSIGRNIGPEIDRIIDHDEIDAIATDKEWRIYYKRLGDEAHKHMLLFDLTYREWFIDDETYTRSPAVRTLEANELIEGSSVVGALYIAEAQSAQLGAPINWEYWTNYKKYTSGIAKDRVKTFRAIFRSPDRTYTVQVGKDADFDNSPKMKDVTLSTSGVLYDGGETYGSPTAIYGKGTRVADPKVSLSGRAKNTQYRFEKQGSFTKVYLYGYEGTIKSGRQR